MRASRNQTGVLPGAAILFIAAVCGCAQLRVPAIDPSGERFFLPNQTTAVQPPSLPTTPEPAFRSPPRPPACAAPSLAGGSAAPVGLGVRPPLSGYRLVLGPGRIVAPVGSEVVLLSGLCGADGYYLTAQPIEWMLSIESVGAFVDVGDSSVRCLETFFLPQTKKISSGYAIGRTSTKPRMITRGTPSPVDDVHVLKGQCWVSVTSAVEGNSHIAVLANGVKGWDQQRMNAVIHWVDAQWVLPSPAVARAGGKHLLTTTITRRNGDPISSGWLVRYETAGGAEAGFAPQGAAAIEIPTDINGQAKAELISKSGQQGATQVRIQVIRLAANTKEPARTIIGQGLSSVTWSAPALSVKTIGPNSGEIDQTLSYRVEVSNPGDIVSRDVVLSDLLPEGLRYLNSTPAPQEFGDRLLWNLGDLQAHQMKTIDINCRAERNGRLRHCVSARSSEGLSAEDCVETVIATELLSIKMTGPESVEVGDPVQFRIEVANRGGVALSGVVATDRFGEGLAHSESQTSPIEKELDELAPGETKKFAITFIAKQPGRLCHTLDVSTASGETASASGCVTAVMPAVPRKAKLEIKLSGPGKSRVGEIVLFTADITNSGDAIAENVEVVFSYSDSLQPQDATENYKQEIGKFSWTYPQLEVGQTAVVQVRYQCLREDLKAVNFVSAQIGFNPAVSKEITMRIAKGAAADPSNNGGGKSIPDPDRPQPKAGKLKLSISDFSDPIKIGSATKYLIIVENAGKETDKNITLRINLPAGMRLKEFDGKIAKQDDRQLEVEPIAELAAGEKKTFRLQLTADEAGKKRLTASAASDLSASDVQADELTTVFEEKQP